jgi:hypothetical protein
VGENWPPPPELDRLKMYDANRKLFEGVHEEVFDTWPRILRQDVNAALEMVLNWPKRLSTLWADLLAGDPPTFTVGDTASPQQQQLDAIIERNHYETLLYDVAIDISRYGDGIMKLALKDGEAIIGGQSPAFWFPVVSIADVRDVRYHVLAWSFEAICHNGEAKYRGKKMEMLKVEIHSKGQIEHRVLAVGPNKTIAHLEEVRIHFPPGISREVQDVFATNGLIEETGVDDFLVQHAPGLRPIDRLFGLDDYTDLETIVQEMEVRLAQISRILDKHTNPTLTGPASLVRQNRTTGETEFLGTGGYMPLNEEDQRPEYLVWDGGLVAAFQELEELKLQFYLVTETSPAAFGQADAGLATSGTALRRLMQAPLAKARRLRMRLDPVAANTLQIAGALENNAKGDDLNIVPTEEDEAAKQNGSADKANREAAVY